MNLLRLAILGAGAAYLYKRHIAGPGEGHAETERAEPFSSEQLDGQPGAGDAEGFEPAAASATNGDPLTQPTWLKPADAD